MKQIPRAGADLVRFAQGVSCWLVFSVASASAATFVVTNAADTGRGSLRQAILDANSSASAAAILFNLPGQGSVEIRLQSPLSAITNRVTIDATTQPGFAEQPLVRLNGVNAGSDVHGLRLLAGNSTVRGLAIGGFSGAGILLGGNDHNLIIGNLIGPDPAGTSPPPNGIGILVEANSAGNTIGGTRASERNWIVGNRSHGLSVASTGNVMQGNFIVGNGGHGVLLTNALANTIGGTTPASRNVISSNGASGIGIHGSAAIGNVIQGNFIGTDRTGARPLGNAVNGLLLEHGSWNNTIGGTTSNERNLICANGQGTVSLAAKGTTSTASGAYHSAADNPSVTPVFGQLIRGGIALAGSGTTNNVVQGNWIGLAADGRSPLPNRPAGMALSAGASYNLIGGLVPGEGNRIAFNLGGGIMLLQDNTLGNSILGNAIYANNGLGLSLTPSEANDQPTANDALDGDKGPNNLQNFPTITNVSYTSSATLVQGLLRSTPDHSFGLDVFHSTSPDPSGYGEGEIYAGCATVTTDESGNAGFSLLAYGDLPARYFTATATDLDTGDTSEFGPVARDASVLPALSISHTTVAEGTNGSVTAGFIVSLSAASTQTVSVNYSTANGTALAGSDYVATNGVLVLNPGEVSKVIEVTVTADPPPEPDEDFFVTLNNPRNATVLAGPGRCLITELRITSIAVAGPDILISFTSSAGSPGRGYCLEQASRLGPELDWTAVASGMGTGGSATLTNAGAARLPNTYYRVLIQPAAW